jgi:Domain of unknown function (DUF5655)/Domain of unknown function (DUF4287)
MARAQATHPYSVHPSVAMVRDWIDALPRKTGRSLDEWLRMVGAQGLPTARERAAWLKSEHGLGTNSAMWIAETSLGTLEETGDPDDYLRRAVGYVEAMLSGRKAALRPVYDELLRIGLGIGPDVKACPCSTIVPLYRNHVFAQLKPMATRIDLGFALRDTPATGRLIDTGGFAKKDRVTHRIPIAVPAEIDDEVRRWLKVAYDMDA